ncbi:MULTISPECIES: hypothetical protein [Kamptonema]|uniref:hypothetical protein n=1 Tax=Kamptonema TaxID=1501433 RepID=UPI0001DACBC3|nr:MULTISPECIES: hypothetical protein [Kamptonema]CBN53932.1 hypothetical protein OSCI_370004 [Kamptonema sp. PCC 6506]
MMIQPKIPQPTISFIDQYCGSYQKIFPEVRSYEAFKQIIMGILTPSKRKSLVTLSKINTPDSFGVERQAKAHKRVSKI